MEISHLCECCKTSTRAFSFTYSW